MVSFLVPDAGRSLPRCITYKGVVFSNSPYNKVIVRYRNDYFIHPSSLYILQVGFENEMEYCVCVIKCFIYNVRLVYVLILVVDEILWHPEGRSHFSVSSSHPSWFPQLFSLLLLTLSTLIRNYDTVIEGFIKIHFVINKRIGVEQSGC